MTRRQQMAEHDPGLAREDREARTPKPIRALYPSPYEDDPREREEILHAWRMRRYGRKEAEE